MATVCCLVPQVPVYANTIISVEIQQDTATDKVFIKLFDVLTPVTVTNFLNYVDDGDYVNSFVHRSAPGFVIQGGGFTFDPTLNDGSFSYEGSETYLGGLQEVPEDPPIVNEYIKSNTQGTIAMAKLGGDPDSANSQWFVNLVDNSSILDNQNGGFEDSRKAGKRGPFLWGGDGELNDLLQTVRIACVLFVPLNLFQFEHYFVGLQSTLDGVSPVLLNNNLVLKNSLDDTIILANVSALLDYITFTSSIFH